MNEHLIEFNYSNRIFDVVDEELLGKLNDKISDTRIRTNELPIRMNSDWLVMLTNEENNPIFSIYKLEDVRNPSIDVIEPTIKLKVISFRESRD
jgi:hypothetical protein